MLDYYYYRPEGPAEDPQPQEKDAQKPRRGRKILKRFIWFTLFIILLIGGLIFGGYWYIQQAPLANDNGRTNILILGVDEVAQLSDTIILLSIDQTDSDNPEAAMVSIPRDLYVPIPEYGNSKINAAYAFGERNDYPGGGTALSAATIEENFDVPIHYYAALDFEGFEKIIDALGGVEVEVKTDIDDPFYPAPGYAGYEPFSIDAGQRQMDGELALKYARSRKTTNDYDRSFRQQQVVLAVQDKVFDSDLLFDINTLNRLIDIFDEHVSTDMTRIEMVKLADVARNLEQGSTSQYVLDSTNLLIPTNNETGSALVPRAGDFSEISQFIEEIFTQDSIEEFEPQQF